MTKGELIEAIKDAPDDTPVTIWMEEGCSWIAATTGASYHEEGEEDIGPGSDEDDIPTGIIIWPSDDAVWSN